MTIDHSLCNLDHFGELVETVYISDYSDLDDRFHDADDWRYVVEDPTDDLTEERH